MKFDLLTERLLGFPFLLVQSDAISFSNHFFFSSAPLPLSLTALLRVGLTAPDLVQLQWSSGGQRYLLNSFHFPLLLPLCFSQSLFICGSTFFSPALVLFFPPPSPPWSGVICRMLWMLCCSAQLLVLLTTEVEWERAEEIENPPPPPLTAQYTALSGSSANGSTQHS